MHVVLAELFPTALFIHFSEVLDERVVVVQNIVVLFDEWKDLNVVLRIECANARVVHQSTLHVVILGIVLLKHGVRDVRHISTSVTLAGDIDLVILDAKLFLVDKVC